MLHCGNDISFDSDTLYERLECEQKEYVDKLAKCYVERSKTDLPEDKIRKKARRLATYHLVWLGPVANTFERGVGARGRKRDRR